MREILFKAKRIDNGEWIEGNLLLYDGIAQIHNQVQLFLISVDPDTICQFTGLTDKNGNKIWENDVVKFPDCEMGTESGYGECFTNTGKISYDAESMSYFITNRITADMQDIYIKDEVEVIGNIFDNPELIS